MLANATRVLPWREVTHCAFSHRGCLHWRIHTPLPCRARPQQGPHRYPRVHYLHLFLARMAHLVIPLLMPSVSPSSIFACFPHHPPVRSQPTRDLGLPPSPRPHPYSPPMPCCSSTGCIGFIRSFCAADTSLLLYTLLCLCRTYCMLLLFMTDQWAVYLYR